MYLLYEYVQRPIVAKILCNSLAWSVYTYLLKFVRPLTTLDALRHSENILTTSSSAFEIKTFFVDFHALSVKHPSPISTPKTYGSIGRSFCSNSIGSFVGRYSRSPRCRRFINCAVVSVKVQRVLSERSELIYLYRCLLVRNVHKCSSVASAIRPSRRYILYIFFTPCGNN